MWLREYYYIAKEYCSIWLKGRRLWLMGSELWLMGSKLCSKGELFSPSNIVGFAKSLNDNDL